MSYYLYLIINTSQTKLHSVRYENSPTRCCPALIAQSRACAVLVDVNKQAMAGNGSDST